MLVVASSSGLQCGSITHATWPDPVCSLSRSLPGTETAKRHSNAASGLSDRAQRQPQSTKLQVTMSVTLQPAAAVPSAVCCM